VSGSVSLIFSGVSIFFFSNALTPRVRQCQFYFSGVSILFLANVPTPRSASGSVSIIFFGVGFFFLPYTPAPRCASGSAVAWRPSVFVFLY
jgi:hypothetical protein